MLIHDQGLDFIGFAKKSTLKTKRLGASKGAKNQKSHSL